MYKNIEIVAASHRKTEPKGFRIFRKKGHDAILFLHFLTPAKLNINGQNINTARNACIIYAPGICHDFGAASDSMIFESNCIAFRTNAAEFLSTFELIINEPFYIENEEEITKAIEVITWAAVNKLQPSVKPIETYVIELFRLLEKEFAINSSKHSRDINTKARFVTMRGEITMDPRGWTVEKMANHCWLARSRFYEIYKSLFGVSPSNDLANMILDYAKDRLASTNDPIAIISKDCGYKRTESFIRMFSNTEGISPGQYRKNFKNS